MTRQLPRVKDRDNRPPRWWQDGGVRFVVGALLVIAGCGAKPPPAVDHAAEEPPPEPGRIEGRVYGVSVARPAIDITRYTPDFHDELRWPLTGMNHPVLEPRFPIAAQLAEPGVTWQEMCARGVHRRVSASQQELLDYLHGWCDVLDRDIDSACAHLRPLLGSLTRGITPAVRQDLANILAAERDVDKAEHWLSKHDIRDIEVLDLLAADFVEVGSHADAATINRRAIDSDSYATDATKCRRLVRQIVLSGSGSATFSLEALRQLATLPKVPDPLCVHLRREVECWLGPATRCAPYLADEHVDSRAVHLIDAYRNWPHEATGADWWSTAERARRALPLPGAVELVVTALEASLRADTFCMNARATAVRAAVDELRADPANAAYEPRLAKLEAACPDPVLPTTTATPASKGR